MTNQLTNLVLIQADQFRWDCLGIRNAEVHTPNLDYLAEQGASFSQVFCPLPVCTPSRYSMLSGTTPHEHGALSNYSTPDPETPMLPEELRRAGYVTSAVGKMHFTPTYHDVGFMRMKLAEQNGPGRYEDDYHAELEAAGLLAYDDLIDQEREYRTLAPLEYWRNFGANESRLPEEWHSTTWIGNKAVEEISGWESGVAQFLHVSFIKPHHPFDPPKKWLELFDEGSLTITPGWTDQIPPQDEAHRNLYFDNGELTEPSLRRVLAHYYASIAHLDFQIGRLIQVLKDQGKYEDTIIVFTSDHGEYLGFHHLLLKGGPLYDPLVRVPLIIKWDEKSLVDLDSDRLVSLIYLAPTILDRIGFTIPPQMSGHSLFRELPRDYVFCETGSEFGLEYMVRSNRFKLLVRRDGAQLFDLLHDPLEMTNLADQSSHNKQVEVMREKLADWILFQTPARNRVREDAKTIKQLTTEILEPDLRRATRQRFDEEAGTLGLSLAPPTPKFPTAD